MQTERQQVIWNEDIKNGRVGHKQETKPRINKRASFHSDPDARTSAMLYWRSIALPSEAVVVTDQQMTAKPL